ncbi:unnamed protein product [marine sediment metagenome]|uniref:30S ribosomal protein S19e n=1 Tax=marine sediment metagenome TaxID=412755 RepID=X0UY73_9ZZZZ
MAKTKALINEVDAEKFINSLAPKLKDIPEFEMPEWARFVKTSVAKERPPFGDWWHIRAASVLRKIYLKGVIGVERLRGQYSSKKDRGAKPEAVRKASGKIIRTILNQAEKAGFVSKSQTNKPGRQLTKKGLEFLNSIISEVKEK